jgi:hypothetical protein
MVTSKVIEAEVKCFSKLVGSRPWKQEDTDEAMECLEIEEALSFGVSVYDRLVLIDEKIRSLALEQDLASDAVKRSKGVKAVKTMKQVFKIWLGLCPEIEADIKRFEKKGYAVAFAKEFRQRHKEARWSVGKAREAFSSKKMTALRDAALEEHAAGNTLPIDGE